MFNKRLRGFTVIELMVSVTIMFVLSLISSRLIKNVQESFKKKEVIMVRNGRVQHLNLKLFSDTLPVALYSTTKGSCPSLKNCLLSSRATRSSHCPTQIMTCDLFDQNTKFAGSKNNPVIIGLDGKKCSKLSSTCPFEVTGYWRYVPGFDSIELWIDIVHNQNYPIKGLGILKPFKGEEESSVFLPLRDIEIWASCEPGEVLVGLTKDTKAICEPVVQYGSNMSSSFSNSSGGSKFTISSQNGVFLIRSTLTDLSEEDYVQERNQAINKLLGHHHIACPAHHILVGLTDEAGPICLLLPYTWRNNNFFICDPSRANCVENMPECPKYPDGKVCDNPGGFCYTLAGSTVGFSYLRPGQGYQYSGKMEPGYNEANYPHSYRPDGVWVDLYIDYLAYFYSFSTPLDMVSDRACRSRQYRLSTWDFFMEKVDFKKNQLSYLKTYRIMKCAQ